MPGDKPIPANIELSVPVYAARACCAVPNTVQPVRVHFPTSPRFPAELSDIDALSDLQALSDLDIQNRPVRTHLPPPPPFPTELEDITGRLKPKPHANLSAIDNPRLPDVLDDVWFEQKLQKLTDMKLELVKARLESQGLRLQDAPSLISVDVTARMQAEQEEEWSDENGCLVKPVEEYTKPFCDFLTENPTVFHAVDYFKKKLTANGFTEVRCRQFGYIRPED